VCVNLKKMCSNWLGTLKLITVVNCLSK